MNAIEVNKVSKIYKDKTQGLNELSLTVKQGEVFTLLGPNGAGKSTLLSILTTLRKPTSGSVSILCKGLVQKTSEIRREIACVAQKTSIDNHLTLRENMVFQGRLYKMDIASIEEKMAQLVNSFGLQNYANKRVIAYSGGIKRRLDIAMSLMSSPKILFLDEPTVGMDIESRQAMWELIQKISLELYTTVFLTTHYLEEADKLSNTICIMQNGHEIVQDTPDNLKQHTMKQHIRIACTTPDAAAKLGNQISTNKGVLNTICLGNTLTVWVEDAQRDYKEISRFVLNHDTPQTGIEIVRPDLDDVFLTLTQERGA